jgi:hypothetical protein
MRQQSITTRWIGALVLASLIASGGCYKTDDIHETDEARSQPCVSCHRAAYSAALNPQHAGTFPDTCGSCHNTNDWRPAALPDHPWFVLDGKHASTTCAKCHIGSPPQYAGRPTNCAGCHAKDFQSSDATPHNAFKQMGTTPDCSMCHRTQGWD